MSEPATILQASSPHGNLEAIVEQDERVTYLYLRAPENEEFGIESCWIRNHSTAPEDLDLDGMNQGIPPMLPREFCLSPDGSNFLDPGRLSLVWFPEGDGIALLEDGQVLAAIPGWAGPNGFPGYARDCVGQSPLCWKLENATDFEERISAANRYWKAWLQEPSPWVSCQQSFLTAYETALGPYSRYFAIDGNKWPPKALAQFDGPEFTYLLTLGVSLRPQPAVERYFEDPTQFRRLELAACFSSEVAPETVSTFARYLSAQADFPWSQFTFFANGHTIPCEAFSNDPKLQDFSYILLVEEPPNSPRIDIPWSTGEQVTLLWAVPITADEQERAKEHGSRKLLTGLSPDHSPHIIGSRSSCDS